MEQLEQRVETLIEEAPVCFITYIDREGYPIAKAMLPPRERKGFREIWFSTNTSSQKVRAFREDPKASVYFMDRSRFQGVSLAGKALALRGVTRNECDGRTGLAVNIPDMLDDIVWCKRHGVNTVVIADAPGHARFLDLADEYGLYIIDCASNLYGPGVARDEAIEAALRRDRAHPSIIAWAIGDEEDEGGQRDKERTTRTPRQRSRTQRERPRGTAGRNDEGESGASAVDSARAQRGLIDAAGTGYQQRLRLTHTVGNKDRQGRVREGRCENAVRGAHEQGGGE